MAFAETRGVDEIRESRERRAHVAAKADERLHVYRRRHARDVEARDEQQIQQDVERKPDGADEQRNVRLVQRPRGIGDGRLHGRAERREGADAHVLETRVANGGRHKLLGESLGSRHEHGAHNQAENGLGQDEGVCQTQPRSEGARRFVPDNDPCRAREALVQHFHDDADIGVDIGRRHERRVDVGDPEL